MFHKINIFWENKINLDSTFLPGKMTRPIGISYLPVHNNQLTTSKHSGRHTHYKPTSCFEVYSQYGLTSNDRNSLV